MKEITTAEELHAILLDIGMDFHRICQKYNIPYYMLGGTMLGAVRHKGFIPWDDDMDFGVPRKYFDKIKEILEKELSENYGVLTMRNSDALLIDIIKIHDKRTIIKELFKENIAEDFGINIDIFPLDVVEKESNDLKPRFIRWLISLQGYRFLSMKPRPLLKKIVALLVKVFFYPLNKFTLVKCINTILGDGKGEYTANIYGAWGTKETVHSEVMGTPKLYSFEDTCFYGVASPDRYLSYLYGDYMKLPPENRRHIHITGMYWR